MIDFSNKSLLPPHIAGLNIQKTGKRTIDLSDVDEDLIEDVVYFFEGYGCNVDVYDPPVKQQNPVKAVKKEKTLEELFNEQQKSQSHIGRYTREA